MTVRCLIVDDEPLVRERVRRLLAEHADMEAVAEAADGQSALDAYDRTRPQLVFLDIQMPGLSGLEVAAIWHGEGSLPVIVFVTAFDQFALDAFRVNAVDYLTKPIDPERFAESLGRARLLLRQQDHADLDRRVRAVLDLHDRRDARRPHLVVKERDRYVLVPTTEVIGLEATGNYVTVHAERAKHLLRGTLSSLESRLDPARFVRVHRSWIVNLEQVREAHPWGKGTWLLVTRSGLQVPVGLQYRAALETILR